MRQRAARIEALLRRLQCTGRRCALSLRRLVGADARTGAGRRSAAHVARRPIALAAALSLALATCTIPVQRREAEPEIVPPEVAIEQFVDLVRSARGRAGCPALAWDARTAAVARDHSGDMLRRGYFSHTSPEGVDPFERLRAAGVAYSAAAENIAYGARNGEEAFRQWYGSRGHRRNMLNCHYTRHGVGVVGDRWTHVLWAP